MSSETQLSCWSPVLLYKCRWVAFLGIAQCVCWLLCAELQGSGVGLNLRDGRYIYVSTPHWSPEQWGLELDKDSEVFWILTIFGSLAANVLLFCPFVRILHFYTVVCFNQFIRSHCQLISFVSHVRRLALFPVLCQILRSWVQDWSASSTQF